MKPLLLLLPLLLLACRPVGPTYVARPRACPPPIRPPAAPPAASRWWEPLGDAQLNGLVQRALAQSPDLRIAEARLRQARAQQGIQEAAGGPDLAVGRQVSRDRLSQNSELLANLPIKGINTEFTNAQVGFDASWELDLFGHNRRLSEAAQARTEASAERLRDAGLVLSAEVARNYIEDRCGSSVWAGPGQPEEPRGAGAPDHPGGQGWGGAEPRGPAGRDRPPGPRGEPGGPSPGAAAEPGCPVHAHDQPMAGLEAQLGDRPGPWRCRKRPLRAFPRTCSSAGPMCGSLNTNWPPPVPISGSRWRTAIHASH